VVPNGKNSKTNIKEKRTNVFREEMAIHQIMYVLPSILQTKAKFLITTSLVFFVLVGVSNSIPVEQPVAASEQSAEPESPMGYIPAELMARYYGNPYNDQEQENVAKRDYQTDQVQEELFPRFVQKKDYSGYGRVNAEKAQGYWNLLKALEEELALERISKQEMEDDGVVENEAAPAGDDVHKVNKRRRRYGFWVTAINKMGGNHLKGFLGKHRNIYNIYKRGASSGKWLPRPLVSSQ